MKCTLMDKWKPACDELNIFYSSLNVQLLLLLWLSKSTPQTSHNTTLMYYMQKRISSNLLQASVLWFIKRIYIHFEIIKLPFGMSTRYSKGGIPKYNVKQLFITSKINRATMPLSSATTDISVHFSCSRGFFIIYIFFQIEGCRRGLGLAFPTKKLAYKKIK